MKKILYSISMLLSVIAISCEEEFSPKEEFKEQYVLFGTIYRASGGTDISADVKLLKTCEVKGFNSYNDKIYPQITNADVVLSSEYMEYKMVEDTIINKKKDSVDVYYHVSDIKIIFLHQKFNIIAKLPDGKILTASTIVPNYPEHNFSYQFFKFTTKIDRKKYGNTWIISWESDNNNLYLPTLRLGYSVWIDGEHSHWEFKSKEIPLRFIKNGSKYEPVYPGAVWKPELEYLFDAIDSTMAQISAGDTNKSKYRIEDIIFGNRVFDGNFSKYYSSINGFLDEYSIRLDESTYSNVSGGIGVFGSSSYLSNKIPVDPEYAALFGYVVGEGN